MIDGKQGQKGRHFSVMLQESVAALVTDPEGIYVDGTFGRGGHSRAILERLGKGGRLIAFDKDPEAVSAGLELAAQDSRFGIVHGSFVQLTQELRARDLLGQVCGVLLDLGVSSPQLDQADRGFSFMKDGPLDMRMNNSEGMAAHEWINSAEQKKMADIFKLYGEERYAKRISAAIVKARQEKEITTTKRFAEIVKQAHPRWEKNKHPATKVFQAVRIYINSELEDLHQVLKQSVECLKVSGRMSVISFHSLEDRIVKRFMRDKAKGKEFPVFVAVTEDMLERELKIIGKALKPSDLEIKDNVRSRSAVLRVAEKI